MKKLGTGKSLLLFLLLLSGQALAGTGSTASLNQDDQDNAVQSTVLDEEALTQESKAALKDKILVGYWHNFDNGSGFIKLRDISPAWDVIHVAFAESDPQQAMQFSPYGYSPEEFANDVKILQGKGKKVSISIGGANSIVKLDDGASRERFIQSMSGIIERYGFDGIDIDLEGASLTLAPGDSDFRSPTTPGIKNLISAIRTLKQRFGDDFLVTMAPETFYVQVGLVAYAGPAGAYLPVIHGLRDILDFIHVQHYNTGSVEGLDGRAYSAATSDFHVALAEMLLRGFPVGRNAAAQFPALREDQVLIGLPAAPPAAGSGFTAPHDVQRAFSYLAEGKSFGGQYALIGRSYPKLRGLMAWSINWDAHHGFEFSNQHRGYLDRLDQALPR